MAEKKWIATELGETALLLPDAIARALRANDRVKYYFSLLQAARDHALRPDRLMPDLRNEREASGERDTSLDDIAEHSRAAPDGSLIVPRAWDLHARLVSDVEAMLVPLREGGVSEAADVTVYEQRLRSLLAQIPAVSVR